MERAQWQRDDRFIPSRMMVDKKEEEEKKRGTREKTKKGHIAASSSSSWREDACRTKKKGLSVRFYTCGSTGLCRCQNHGPVWQPFFSVPSFFFLSLSLGLMDTVLLRSRCCLCYTNN